jgi:hypothetical protein
MRRRDFIAVLSSASLALPLAARAQRSAMPVIGVLHPQSPEPYVEPMRGFRQGLKDAGFVDGENVMIDSSREIDAAFENIGRERPDALFVTVTPFFVVRRVQLVHLATLRRVPAVYGLRDFAESGGLMSYGTSLKDAYRQVGVYTGRVLNGTKPADLPVVQSSKFELVINAQTARMLGLTIPPSLLATADEVIE